jgi:hypothetical protein
MGKSVSHDLRRVRNGRKVKTSGQRRRGRIQRHPMAAGFQGGRREKRRKRKKNKKKK